MEYRKMVMVNQTPTLVSQEDSVRWWLPERIIYVVLQEGTTPASADWRLHQVIGLIHTCATPHVHVMIEVQNGRTLPNVFYPVSRRLISQPRRGWIATVIAYPPSQQHLLNLFTRLTYLRYTFCATRQAALETLKGRDSSLPHLVDFKAHN